MLRFEAHPTQRVLPGCLLLAPPQHCGISDPRLSFTLCSLSTSLLSALCFWSWRDATAGERSPERGAQAELSHSSSSSLQLCQFPVKCEMEQDWRACGVRKKRSQRMSRRGNWGRRPSKIQTLDSCKITPASEQSYY